MNGDFSMTLKDIAQEVGISYQAVSAVLNNRPGIRVSAKRREQILEIARKGGYQRNFSYNLFHRRKTNTMAVIPSVQFQKEMGTRNWLICHLLSEGNVHGFAAYFDNGMTQDEENNLARIRALEQRGVENFIFIGTPCGYLRIMEELKKLNRNYIGCNSRFDRNIESDFFTASLNLVDFARSQVGDNLKLIIPYPAKIGSSKRREALMTRYPMPEKEFCDRFLQAVPPAVPSKARYTDQFRNGSLAAEKIMSRVQPPVGLICHTDFYAAGAADWLTRHGYQVGRDAVITGFDNELVTQFAPYPISSASMDCEEVVRLLLEHMDRSDELQIKIPARIWLRK